MHVMRSYNLAVTTLLLSVTGAAAQLPPPTVVPLYPIPIRSVRLCCRRHNRRRSRQLLAELDERASHYSILITRSAAYFVMDRVFLITGHRSDRIYG